MLNLNMIKKYLREISTDILFFYKSKKNTNKVITYLSDGTIVFNTAHVFQKLNIKSFQKNSNDNEESKKDRVFILFRYLFHEMIRHTKFMYKDY